MWIPKSVEELEQCVEAGDLDETRVFEAKKELPKNIETAKDITAMTVNGGVLIYGLAEDDQKRPTVLNPIPLKGQAERIDSIAKTGIQEPPFIRIIPMTKPDNKEVGYIVVVIPQSERAPHMVVKGNKCQYYGRSDKGNVRLDEGQVALLYERRRKWEVDRDELIDREIANAPFEPSPNHAYLFLFARPVARDESLLHRALNGDENFGMKLHNLVNTAATREGLYPSGDEPAFRPRHSWLIRRNGYFGELGEPSIEGPSYCVNLQVDYDGTCHLFCGRAAERLSDRYCFFEGLVKGHTAKFVSLMAEICEGAGYAGMVDVGLAITGLRGTEIDSYDISPIMTAGLRTYYDDDYRESGRFSAYQLKDEPKTVTSKLLKRLFDAMTQRTVDFLK